MSIVNALMHLSAAIAQHPDPARKIQLTAEVTALGERLSEELWAFFQVVDAEISREEEG